MIYADIKKLFDEVPVTDWGIEQALAKRTCHECHAEILRGEYHLAMYSQSKGKLQYTQRFNMCMICGLPMLNNRRDDIIKVIAAVKEYLTLNTQITNRQILTKMREGTYQKEEEL